MKKLVFVFALSAMFATSCSNNEDLVEESEEHKTRVEDLRKFDKDVRQRVSDNSARLKLMKELTAAPTRYN